jgi:hypothetical protein
VHGARCAVRGAGFRVDGVGCRGGSRLSTPLAMIPFDAPELNQTQMAEPKPFRGLRHVSGLEFMV